MISPHSLMAIAPAYATHTADQARMLFPQEQRSASQFPKQIGFVELVGVLSKGDLVRARQRVNELAANDRIGEILILVDSPGGSVAGTHDLYLAIAAAAERKPVTAFIEDMGASAAYYAIAGATEIVVNTTGAVGSIGVYVVLTDASRALERAGVDVIVIRSGSSKGTGVEGAKISPEQLEQVQAFVDTQARHFVVAVSRGREMSLAKVSDLADGRVLIGTGAVAAGLVDRVGMLEDVEREIRERTEGFALGLLDGREAQAKFDDLVAERIAGGDTPTWAEHQVRKDFPQLGANVSNTRSA